LGSDPGAQPENALVLPQIESGAFGNGSHPTTRLCAGAVDLVCRQNRPRAVLDVGTGTGVLARIARARGAAKVVATDIYEVAIASAREHARLDVHPVEILVSSEAPDHWGPEFDLVVANILEKILIELGPALAAALAPRGVLLVSGFTPIQIPALRVFFTGLGLEFVTESVLEDWALLMFRRA
jgi:ribosomal protein L11 methyltransferase